ncbi:hypothetical protein B4U79_07937 [Dinothrombium tinctorium]|uniref:Sialin-like protein n=1 Tax=Dinothrombium tinctorium TaxID=1965070 RepID=A0A3S3PD61_9ACAR|nr:hypothetical protein B4U79_07937 [Dinothrombium tinctorium]
MIVIKDDEKCILTSSLPARKWSIQSRFVLVTFGFFGFFMLYALKIDLSVAIVSMVKSSNSAHNGTRISTECLTANASQHSIINSNGEFSWSENTKSYVLGSFFWGYVLTQIPGGRLAEKFGSKHLLGFGLVTASEVSIRTWSYVFYIASSSYTIGGIVFLVFGSAKLQPWGLDNSLYDR